MKFSVFWGRIRKMTGFIRCSIVKFNIKDGCIWRYRVIPEATIIPGDWPGPVQTGCSCSSLSAAKYHLREKSIAYPTERSKMRSILKLAGKDVRFSMKMMFAVGS